MRAVVQRVSSASVDVGDERVGAINKGLLVLLGVGTEDEESDADYLLKKIVGLRVFEDDEGRMNRSLSEIEGDLLVVSQFTLFGDVKKGFRPSFIKAARPEKASELYNYFCSEAEKDISRVETGKFGAMMDVNLVNDGPVTILIDSKKKF